MKICKIFFSNGGSLTIDAWSRVIFQLKNLQEVFVDTKLQTVSSYKARVLTVLLNRGVMASKMDCS